MAEFFSKYQKRLAAEKKNAAKLVSSPEERAAFQKQFFEIFTKMQSNEKDKSVKGLSSKKDQEQFEAAVSALELEDLLSQTKLVIIELEKAKKMKELEKSKASSQSKGMFGWFRGSSGGAGSNNNKSDSNSSSSGELVTEEDRLKMDQFIRENLTLEEAKVDRAPEYVWFRLKFVLVGLEVCLRRQIRAGCSEGVDLNLIELRGEVLLREDNKEALVCLQSLCIDSVSWEADRENRTNFLSPQEN